MQVIKEEARYPLEGYRFLEEIKAVFGKPEYIPDYRLPDTSKRTQVRFTEHVAVPANVRKFKLAYQREELVPPIVVTMDGYLVDGASRTEARRELGLGTIPAFRLNIKLEEATEVQLRDLEGLGTALNGGNGMDMTKAEIAARVESMLLNGMTRKDLAARLHISENVVNGVAALSKGRERMGTLGITVEKGLKESHVRLFGYSSRQLTNTVLRPLAELVRDHGMSVSDLGALLKQLGTVTEESEKLELIAQVKTGSRPLVPGTSRRSDNSTKVTQALSRFKALPSPRDSVETRDAAAAEKRLRELDWLIEWATKARQEQLNAVRAVTYTPPPPVSPFTRG